MWAVCRPLTTGETWSRNWLHAQHRRAPMAGKALHERQTDMMRCLRLLLILTATAILLSGCGTVGGLVEGTGKVIQKGGRTIGNL
jgi:predicted small secreted protein